LNLLKEQVNCTLSHEGGAEAYFGSYITDGVKKQLLGIEVNFWSESEYAARPNVIYGHS
jgi:hypothetical protein